MAHFLESVSGARRCSILLDRRSTKNKSLLSRQRTNVHTIRLYSKAPHAHYLLIVEGLPIGRTHKIMPGLPTRLHPMSEPTLARKMDAHVSFLAAAISSMSSTPDHMRMLIDATSAHQRQHYPPFQCEEVGCGARFQYKKDLERHRQGQHSERTPLLFCDHEGCNSKMYSQKSGVGTTRRDNLARHMRTHRRAP